MAYRITIHIVDPQDKKIHVTHRFYGESETEALAWMTRHVGACEYFRAQSEAGNTTEPDVEYITATQWPEAEENGDVLDMERFDE